MAPTSAPISFPEAPTAPSPAALPMLQLLAHLAIATSLASALFLYPEPTQGTDLTAEQSDGSSSQPRPECVGTHAPTLPAGEGKRKRWREPCEHQGVSADSGAKSESTAAGQKEGETR